MALMMTSMQFRSEVEPILNKVVDGLYLKQQQQYKEVFDDVNGIPRAYHEEPYLFGLPAAPLMPEGTAVIYDQGGELYRSRFIYVNYGLAFALTKILVEDGEAIPFAKTFSEFLTRSMIERQEIDGANVLNRAFNAAYPGGDGVAFMSASHPTASGGVQSNLLNSPAALSYTSLVQILQQIDKARDAVGNYVNLSTKQLIVSPDNDFEAETILNSVLQSSNANNGINAVKSMNRLKKKVMLSRLTSTTAWFVQTDSEYGLRFFWRRRPDKSMYGDFETDSMRYKQTMRYITGAPTDWRAGYGTPGQ